MKQAIKNRIPLSAPFRWAAVLTADVLLCLAVAFFPAVRDFAIRYAPVCPLYAVGLRCGLCGGTHCLTALYNGHLTAAVRYNAYLVFFLAVAAAVLVLAHICLFFPHGKAAALYKKLTSPKAILWLTGGWLGFMILRNSVIIAEKYFSGL